MAGIDGIGGSRPPSRDGYRISRDGVKPPQPIQPIEQPPQPSREDEKKKPVVSPGGSVDIKA